MHWEVSSFDQTKAKVALVCIKGSDPQLLSHIRNVPALQSLKSEALSIRLFYDVSNPAGMPDSTSLALWFSLIYIPAASAPLAFFTNNNEPVPITPIPSRFLASRNGDGWDYAILATCT